MTPWLRVVRTTGLAGAGVLLLCGGTLPDEGVLPGEGVSSYGRVPPGGSVSSYGSVPPGDDGRAPAVGASAGASAAAGPGRRERDDQADRGDRGEAAATAVGESSEETSPAYDSASSHGHRRTPAARASASARPEPSRAGSRAGEGRERPGRRWWDERDEEDQDSGQQGDYPGKAYPDQQDASVPPQDATPGASVPTSRSTQQAASHAEAPAEPVLRILPLGSGLVLIGLGLGLAFVGLRLRRG